MNNFEKSMEQIFDVTPVESKKTDIIDVTSEVQKVDANNMTQDLTDAYQQSRENLQGMIDQGKEAMDEILEIAKQGQHPRAFEVYGTLLKNMVDANKELLNIQKQMREMDGSKKDQPATSIDKAIFIGSTKELNKLLKGNDGS